MMRGDGAAEALQMRYLLKLRQIQNGMNLIAQFFTHSLWRPAARGLERANSELWLLSWPRSRPVVVPRRRMKDALSHH